MSLNLFENLPDNLPEELFSELFKSDKLRVERILSKGQITPNNEWYDQAENEWVLLIQGQAILAYEDGSERCLKSGDHVNIPAHVKHRVKWTCPDQTSIWLAVFY